jgi:choline dehydrogenase-like flavoprotein
MIYDVIVVGTGAGGATVAKELSKEGLKVLILEKGKPYKMGTAVNYIKNVPVDFKLKKDLIKNSEYDFLKYSPELMYIEGMGGTTTVSLANACYSCSACYYNSAISQLESHDLNLFEELIEASGDLKVSPLPSRFMGRGTLKIAKAAEKLGFIVESMPKFIDFDKCDNCGLCIYGCTKGAKWDATHFIDEAAISGAKILWDFEVLRVIHEDEIAIGVEGRTSDGKLKKFEAYNVVLAAGSLNTPHILRNSGVTEGVGEGLFVDLFITVGGYLRDVKLNQEIPMGVKSEFGPYFLSPHFSNQLVQFIQEKGFPARAEDVLGIMIKIADEANGLLHPDGSIEKPLTKTDLDLLKEGYDKAVEILVEAGVDESIIVSTPIRGAHPGGTAAMGRVVNKSMETSVKGLFVSDASVIPRAPGRPPILTITAIAKSVAKTIIQEMKNKKSNKTDIFSDVSSHQ